MPLSSDPIKRQRQLANLARRPPAPEPGNRRAVTHGGFARIAGERQAAKVKEVFDALSEDLPLHDRADDALVHLCATALCRLEDVSGYLTNYGIVDGKTDQLRTAAIELEGRLRREIGDHLDALGCSPRSRVKLGADVTHAAVDAATLLSAAREESDPDLRRQMLERGGLIDPPGGPPIADHGGDHPGSRGLSHENNCGTEVL